MLVSTRTIAAWVFFGAVMAHVVLRLRLKAARARQRPRGEVHQKAIFGQMMVWYLFFIVAAFVESLSGVWSFHWDVAALGAILYGVTVWIQWKAFEDLGDAYSPDIEVRREQHLVTKGIYGTVRHPLLSALLLEVVAVALFMNAYIVLGVSLICFIPVIWKRMKEEEKVLIGHFGEAYQTYSMHVGGLFPRWFH